MAAFKCFYCESGFDKGRLGPCRLGSRILCADCYWSIGPGRADEWRKHNATAEWNKAELGRRFLMAERLGNLM